MIKEGEQYRYKRTHNNDYYTVEKMFVENGRVMFAQMTATAPRRRTIHDEFSHPSVRPGVGGLLHEFQGITPSMLGWETRCDTCALFVGWCTIKKVPSDTHCGAWWPEVQRVRHPSEDAQPLPGYLRDEPPVETELYALPTHEEMNARTAEPMVSVLPSAPLLDLDDDDDKSNRIAMLDL